MNKVYVSLSFLGILGVMKLNHFSTVVCKTVSEGYTMGRDQAIFPPFVFQWLPCFVCDMREYLVLTIMITMFSYRASA